GGCSWDSRLVAIDKHFDTYPYILKQVMYMVYDSKWLLLSRIMHSSNIRQISKPKSFVILQERKKCKDTLLCCSYRQQPMRFTHKTDLFGELLLKRPPDALIV